MSASEYQGERIGLAFDSGVNDLITSTYRPMSMPTVCHIFIIRVTVAVAVVATLTTNIDFLLLTVDTRLPTVDSVSLSVFVSLSVCLSVCLTVRPL